VMRRAHRAARGAGAHRRGLDAEALAEAYLRLSGWRVLARRWKARGGEADLIALRAGVLAVVEVKARRTLDAALMAVTPRAWARVTEAGRHFLAHADVSADVAVRLDLIAVAPPLEVEHVPGAGEATEPL
jgi:putative endonuclease